MTRQDFIKKYSNVTNEKKNIILIIKKIYNSDIRSLSDEKSYNLVSSFAEGQTMGSFIDDLTKEKRIISVNGYQRKYNRQVNDFFYFIIRMMKYSQSDDIKAFLSIKTEDYIQAVSEYIFPDIEDFSKYINDSEITLEDCFSNIYLDWHDNGILHRQNAQRALFYLFLFPLKYVHNRRLNLMLKEKN